MKKQLKKEKGITLVALVITIIILLILVTIGIQALTGSGLFEKTKQAKQANLEAEAEEEINLKVSEVQISKNGAATLKDFVELLGEPSSEEYIVKTTPTATINQNESDIKSESDVTNETNIIYVTNVKYGVEISVTKDFRVAKTGNTTTPAGGSSSGGGSGSGGSGTGDDSSSDATGTATVAQANASTRCTTESNNVEVEDKFGNTIIVPSKFKIADESITDGKIEIPKGVVIEDGDGNQFVWVPVGKIYTDTSKTEANAKTIELGRYEFSTGAYSSSTRTKKNGSDAIDTNYTETEYNTEAKCINDFKASATTNGGYYIGRYEAGTETGRNASSNALTTMNVKAGQNVYNYVTRDQAKNIVRNMYLREFTKGKFECDLINSYAWDTAIIFMEQCGNNSDYAHQTRLQNTLTTTGGAQDSSNNKDVQCNVYDMAGNVYEWSTEYSTVSGGSFVYRGGTYAISSFRTSLRLTGESSLSQASIGFRPLLYL